MLAAAKDSTGLDTQMAAGPCEWGCTNRRPRSGRVEIAGICEPPSDQGHLKENKKKRSELRCRSSVYMHDTLLPAPKTRCSCVALPYRDRYCKIEIVTE